MLTAGLLSMALAASPGPAPLVPNGAILTNVQGQMVQPSADAPWTFRLIGGAADPDGRHRDFILLPCRILEEMESVQATEENSIFVLTGEVTLFGGRNWLMPRHVERRTAHAPRSEPTIAPPDPGDDSFDADMEDGMREGVAAGDSVADIVADLQASFGGLARSLDTGETAESKEFSKPDGTLIVSRRGRLLRSQRGAWLFVFDADAWGQADAPVVLLPSPILDRLVREGRHSDYRSPIHLSGAISQYHGRRFLMPTAITSHRERPNLSR